MGYNLAIEYLADYEKTWMLDSFRALDARVLAPQGRPLTEWVFLEVSQKRGRVEAAAGAGRQGGWCRRLCIAQGDTGAQQAEPPQTHLPTRPPCPPHRCTPRARRSTPPSATTR